MNKAGEALTDVRRWLCDNLSDGDAGKVCGMLSVVSRHANELEQENDKLRNLMQRRVKDYMYESCGDCWGGLCDECLCWVSECADELRELGIEVDE